MITPTLFLILFRYCFANRSMQNMFQDAVQLATQEAQHLARFDIESSDEGEILFRRSRFSRSDLCVAQNFRISYPLFVHKYVCPLLRTYMGDFCKGRGEECFKCSTTDIKTRQHWNLLKCKPATAAPHDICSQAAIDSAYCPNSSPQCPLTFYNSNEVEPEFRRTCCIQQLNLGQTLSCNAAASSFEKETLEFKLSFNPCRQQKDCSHDINPSKEVSMKLEVYQPNSCCASISWS